jgi:hypothetical protein
MGADRELIRLSDQVAIQYGAEDHQPTVPRLSLGITLNEDNPSL